MPREAGKPVSSRDLAAWQEPPDRVQKTMRLLAQRAVLVNLGEKGYLHRQAIERAPPGVAAERLRA